MRAENKKKILDLAGIARKAGLLEFGTEKLRESARRSEIKLVIVSSDASANTEKRIKNCCAFYEVPCADVDATSEEFARAVGLKGPCAALGIRDGGIADAMLKYMANTI